jgi:hypothetical protein
VPARTRRRWHGRGGECDTLVIDRDVVVARQQPDATVPVEHEVRVGPRALHIREQDLTVRDCRMRTELVVASGSRGLDRETAAKRSCKVTLHLDGPLE